MLIVYCGVSIWTCNCMLYIDNAKAGFFRVSFSSQLMAAAAAAFAHAAGMPVDWTDSTSTVLVIHLVVLSIGIAHVHYYNVMNDKLVPDMKRPGSVCSVGYGRS
ncbi:hypothetical protein PRIPAC_87379 [Pristionchus pacificus]|uniref:Uncharacterized protein n=1 Tax=Pristionchus pacificus TaxID=54126 RepID=A0A2A6CVK9_PRIPA|nr:hypothetical protein PRIPAC_87379 [Pristionchus pacificus]|eukprot:PDM82158.1 hypothetical protein PRIPAC_36551 [Pristionchus pacificus]